MLKSNFSGGRAIEKVVLSVGLSEHRQKEESVNQIMADLAKIAAQKPVKTRAKKAISTFKIRKGDSVGLMVTLRGQRMLDFLEKLVKIVLPRLKGFRGLSLKSFDQQGNFHLGFREQVLFPEIEPEKTSLIFGLEVSIKTRAKNPDEGRLALEELGFLFER
ncbi:50S ribosomal protein L5 [Candidatus Berkelbacteria bacterium]|nr:50S ribosomal protein L5 [Candidatus Berkelbacteria bacterium]MBI4029967.1 50S ribosomal protein L5 [Candidatus Berkelbacteria bacterium]